MVVCCYKLIHNTNCVCFRDYRRPKYGFKAVGEWQVLGHLFTPSQQHTTAHGPLRLCSLWLPRLLPTPAPRVLSRFFFHPLLYPAGSPLSPCPVPSSWCLHCTVEQNECTGSSFSPRLGCQDMGHSSELIAPLYVQYIQYSTAVCTVYTVQHCCMYSIYSTALLYVQYIQYSTAVCTVYTVQHCCMYSIYSTALLYVQYIQYSTAVCTVYTVQHCCKYSIYSTAPLYVQYMQHYVQYGACQKWFNSWCVLWH